MKYLQKALSIAILTTCAGSSFAAPMPPTIVVQDKAVVPVLKTEVIRKVKGQLPVRSVDATIFEVTNKGKDILAREVYLDDNQTQFSEKKLAVPVLKKGGIIIPTSKIEVSSQVKQAGETVAETKKIDAEGVEFKPGQDPVKRTLKLDQNKNVKNNLQTSHAVLTENGERTKDIVILSEDE